jgi:hypothetical protein
MTFEQTANQIQP